VVVTPAFVDRSGLSAGKAEQPVTSAIYAKFASGTTKALSAMSKSPHGRTAAKAKDAMTWIKGWEGRDELLESCGVPMTLQLSTFNLRASVMLDEWLMVRSLGVCRTSNRWRLSVRKEVAGCGFWLDVG